VTERVTATFAGDLASVGDARSFVEAQLRAHHIDEPRRSDLVVAAHEVVTNAMCHGRGPVTVEVHPASGRLRVEVHDCGGGQPTLRPASPDRPGGWGLQLLNRYADAWGTTVAPQRTTVWFDTHCGD
jgi:anti-sigma regulatory factor (Ser/Thr protein kinase)